MVSQVLCWSYLFHPTKWEALDICSQLQPPALTPFSHSAFLCSTNVWLSCRAKIRSSERLTLSPALAETCHCSLMKFNFYRWPQKFPAAGFPSAFFPRQNVTYLFVPLKAEKEQLGRKKIHPCILNTKIALLAQLAL